MLLRLFVTSSELIPLGAVKVPNADDSPQMVSGLLRGGVMVSKYLPCRRAMNGDSEDAVWAGISMQIDTWKWLLLSLSETNSTLNPWWLSKGLQWV